MKKIFSVLLTLAIIASVGTVVFATVPGGLTPDTSLAQTNFQTPLQKILGMVQFVGYAFAIGMLLYLGIKYMMASANEKADLKKGSINYVIGAVILFGAATIVGWINSFGANL